MEIKNITKAILQVMAEVKGIDKSMQVGSGAMSYKGVPDQEVKKIIGEAMQKAGLAIVPISIEPKTTIDRWEEQNTYNGQPTVKTKQSITTEVTTKYLLLHESGESLELSGYGHGVDSQDKGAGKATTYALKYCLLYTFLVPTGKIDDADSTHSDSIATPPQSKQEDNRQWLNEGTSEFVEAVKWVSGGNPISKIEAKYKLSKVVKQLLLDNSQSNGK